MAQAEHRPDELEDHRVVRRFKPKPAETSIRSRKGRRGPHSGEHEETNEMSKASPRRRFAPDLIETSQHSRRSGYPVMNEGSSSPNALGLSTRSNESGLAFRQLFPSDPSGELSLSLTSAARRPLTLHQRSFQVPKLEPIQSSGSDESKCPSLSTPPSAHSKGRSVLSNRARRFRESCDNAVSGHLRELATKAAEERLQEQAMAAFPNSEFHQRVDHFAVARESDESELESDVHKPRIRRVSAADCAWELVEIRKYHERPGKQRRSSLTEGSSGREYPPPPRSTGSFRKSARDGRMSSMEFELVGDAQGIISRWQPNVDRDTMRDAARQPMLGQGWNFRGCPSPQSTDLLATSYPSPVRSDNQDRKDGKGLWRGLCLAGQQGAPVSERGHSGLQTPDHEGASPPSLDQLSFRLKSDEPDEVSDEFVSQVYNYLSLGYPSVARKYDQELSKISKIPLLELSRDDGMAAATGFVGLNEGVGMTEKAAMEGQCSRWIALRIYIKEWMRQHANLAAGYLGPDAWGVRARRGSWAI